jgi:hypothetical protein
LSSRPPPSKRGGFVLSETVGVGGAFGLRVVVNLLYSAPQRQFRTAFAQTKSEGGFGSPALTFYLRRSGKILRTVLTGVRVFGRSRRPGARASASAAQDEERRDARHSEGDGQRGAAPTRQRHEQRQQKYHRPRRGEGEKACEQ